MLLLFLEVCVDYEVCGCFRGKGNQETCLCDVLPIVYEEIFEIVGDCEADGGSLGEGVFLFVEGYVSFFFRLVDFLDFATRFWLGSGARAGSDAASNPVICSGAPAGLLSITAGSRGGYFFTFESSFDAGGSLRPDTCRTAGPSRIQRCSLTCPLSSLDAGWTCANVPWPTGVRRCESVLGSGFSAYASVVRILAASRTAGSVSIPSGALAASSAAQKLLWLSRSPDKSFLRR